MGLPRWLAGSIMSFFRRVATNVYAPNTCNPRRSISLGIVAVAAVLFGPAVAHSQSAVRTPAVQITTAGRKYLVDAIMARRRRHIYQQWNSRAGDLFSYIYSLPPSFGWEGRRFAIGIERHFRQRRVSGRGSDGPGFMAVRKFERLSTQC